MQDTNGNFFGEVLFDFMDAEIQTILQLLDLSDDTLPIFVTDGVVTNQALGYHNAAVIADRDGSAHLSLGSTPQGQGHQTMAAQVAADRLGCQSWKLRELIRRGHFRESCRAGRFRLIAESQLPQLEAALLSCGYLPGKTEPQEE